MEQVFQKEIGSDFSISFIKARLSEQTVKLCEGHQIVCVFVNDNVGEGVVKKLKEYGVSLIALRCAGFNNVDIEACEKEGLSVVRVPAYSPYAVAEHATAMLLCLNRKLHKAYNRVREGNFSLNELVGFDIHGKTVGVIGTGKIGAIFVNHMLGFGANVKAYDIYENKELSKLEGFSYSSLD